jgi:hypothetical protein
MFRAVVQMALPHAALLDIPAPLWVPMGFAILALIERIATMPARIAQKREQERLKTAIARKQIQLVSEGRADVLLHLAPKENRFPRESPNEVGADIERIQSAP